VSTNDVSTQELEPIGIIISEGPRLITPPRVAAYIYAAADEPAETDPEIKAA
jgi:hypothetical protein